MVIRALLSGHVVDSAFIVRNGAFIPCKRHPSVTSRPFGAKTSGLPSTDSMVWRIRGNKIANDACEIDGSAWIFLGGCQVLFRRVRVSGSLALRRSEPCSTVSTHSCHCLRSSVVRRLRQHVVVHPIKRRWRWLRPRSWQRTLVIMGYPR